jgi:hypothetical protein
MEFILMLLLCEPSIVYYPVFDHPPQQVEASRPWPAPSRRRFPE